MLSIPIVNRTTSQQDGLIYCAGSAISAYLNTVNNCMECEKSLCSNSPLDSFTQFRKFDVNSHLLYPNETLLSFFIKLENFLHRQLRFHVTKRNIVQEILTATANEVHNHTVNACETHLRIFDESLRRIWIRKSIRFYCQLYEINEAKKRRDQRKRKILSKSYENNKMRRS